MRLDEISAGKWIAKHKRPDQRPSEWKTLRMFNLYSDESYDDARARIATEYDLSPAEVFIYNVDDEFLDGDVIEDSQLPSTRKINGGKGVRKSVNVHTRNGKGVSIRPAKKATFSALKDK
jgi:hypothetical protein